MTAKFIPLGQEDPMSTLCRMVTNTKYEDLSSDVITFAKHSILDTIAVIIGGSAMEGIPELVKFVKNKGGKPESIIPFYGGKVPASEAGLVIGPMARAMDFGQVHEEAGHNSEYIVPTLLAAAGLKNRLTGKEFLTAFVVGQEVCIRIGIAWRTLSEAIPRGRASGHSIFGAVAAVGKLMGLNLDELENAEGIGRGKTQPHDLAMIGPATLMVRVHHGFICQDAINACLLAKIGITGPRQEVLVGPRGYLEMAKWETAPDALVDGLGEKWEMMNVMMKPYASCKGTHTAVGGVLEQMVEQNFSVEDIAKINIDESSTNWSFVCIPKETKWNPRTVAECQFSLPYAVASAAFDNKLFLDAYTRQAMARQNVRELMTRISAMEDSNLPPWAAEVKTTLKNGKTYSKRYLFVKGHPKNPFTEKELIDRFKMCVPYSAYELSEGAVNSIINAILDLEQVHDVVSAIILPLAPG